MSYYKCSPRIAVGKGETITTDTTHVSIGFKPRYLYITIGTSETQANPIQMQYNEDISSAGYFYATSGAYSQTLKFPQTGANRIGSINDDGFTLNKQTSSYKFYKYIAIG